MRTFVAMVAQPFGAPPTHTFFYNIFRYELLFTCFLLVYIFWLFVATHIVYDTRAKLIMCMGYTAGASRHERTAAGVAVALLNDCV